MTVERVHVNETRNKNQRYVLRDGDGDDDQDAEEAAWQTAVEAAPWLIGKREPEEGVDPDELFDKLKPFQERVAADIRDEEPGSE